MKGWVFLLVMAGLPASHSREGELPKGDETAEGNVIRDIFTPGTRQVTRQATPLLFESSYIPLDPTPPTRGPARPHPAVPVIDPDSHDGEITSLGQLRSQLVHILAQTAATAPADDLSNTNATSAGCQCSPDGVSGGVAVPAGCGTHGSDGAAFCYVSDPSTCGEFAIASTAFPGASWRYCDTPDAVPDPTNTQMDHSVADGYHTFTMQHQGLKATLITEGNHTLSEEEGRERSQQLLGDMAADQAKEKANLTAAVNETQAQAQEAIGAAAAAVGSALDDALASIDATMRETMGQGGPGGAADSPPPSFDQLYKRIFGDVMAHTAHLRPTKATDPAARKAEAEEDGEAAAGSNTFDRLMGMSDRILARMDAKVKAVQKHMVEQAKSHDSPVSVVTHTTN